MKRYLRWGVAFLALTLTATAWAGEKSDQLRAKLAADIDASTEASDAVKKFMKEVLMTYCDNAVFVAEIKKQNASDLPMDQIMAWDKEWAAAESEIPLMKRMMGNATADEVRRIVALHPPLAETFVMDKRGANVGQNEPTSDYFQGDEAKWSDTYEKHTIWIGKDSLDQSTFQKLQHVSFPIFDENGEVVGAICWGVKTGAL